MGRVAFRVGSCGLVDQGEDKVPGLILCLLQTSLARSYGWTIQICIGKAENTHRWDGHIWT